MINILFLLCCFCLMLSGLLLMRLGLKNTLSSKLNFLFEKFTAKPWQGMIVGIVAASLLQSSTAVTISVIGFVSAEYMTFHQGLGIILGANIGTCSTVQLLTLDLPLQILVPLTVLFLVAATISKKYRYPSLAFCGMMCMLLGIRLMSEQVQEISSMDTVLSMLKNMYRNPINGIIGGILTTLSVQSSSAATGLLMLLAEEQLLDLKTATYFVYGNNIGSCLSSLIVGLAAPTAAKRIAVSHLLLNILGVAVFLPISDSIVYIVQMLTSDFAYQIAAVHTLFNLLSSLIALPFINRFADLIILIVPDTSRNKKTF